MIWGVKGLQGIGWNGVDKEGNKIQVYEPSEDYEEEVLS